jgi:hypothetical protein
MYRYLPEGLDYKILLTLLAYCYGTFSITLTEHFVIDFW